MEKMQFSTADVYILCSVLQHGRIVHCRYTNSAVSSKKLKCKTCKNAKLMKNFD